MEYRAFKDTYMLRIDIGEEITESLKKMCKQEGIRLAEVNAIGASDHAVVGVYDLQEQAYRREELTGFMEIAGLTGSVTSMDGNPYVHLHAVLADGENRLQVSVEFTKNGLFSKYDVDLYCDDVLIARMPHGKDYEGTWLVSSGTHLIMFCKAGDRSVRGSVTVKAEGDAAFSCRIEAERNKVRIDRDRLTY